MKIKTTSSVEIKICIWCNETMFIMSQTVCQRKRGNSIKVLHLPWKETMLPNAANEAAAKGAKLASVTKEKEKNRRCYRSCQ